VAYNSGDGAGVAVAIRREPMPKYVVAVKTEFRAGDFSVDTVKEVPGIRIASGVGPNIAVIEATRRAVSELKRRFGKKLIVEREIEHRLS
jgi:hypothetical protein